MAILFDYEDFLTLYESHNPSTVLSNTALRQIWREYHNSLDSLIRMEDVLRKFTEVIQESDEHLYFMHRPKQYLTYYLTNGMVLAQYIG